MREGDEVERVLGAPHPVIDVLTERRAITFAQRPVIALTSGLSDAVARFSKEGRVVTVVTGPEARVTLPVRELASARALQWVVQTGERSFFDAMSGKSLMFDGGDFTLTGDGAAAPFEATPTLTHWQVLVVLTVEHRASTQTRLGGALEAVALALTGAPPDGWGAFEPASEAWSRDAYTAFVRARMPTDTRSIAVGADGAMVASLFVQRTERGVEEQLVALVAGGQVSRSVDELRVACVEALRAASESETLGFGWLLVRPGSPTLDEAARRRATPVPLAMVIGPRAVRALGREALLTTPLGKAGQVGRPRTPSLIWALGENGRSSWEQLAQFVQHVGPHKLAEAAPQLLEGP